MKLNDFTTKIPPLPWRVHEYGITNSVRAADNSCIATDATDCGDPISEEVALYICHAANNLPKVVEAAKAMIAALENPAPKTGALILDAIANFKSALAYANDVRRDA